MFSIRVGDVAVGICPCPPSMCPSTGVVSTGDPTHIDSGTPISRIGDIVMFPCGGFVITAGNPIYIYSGMPAADLGSPCVGAGNGVIATGNPTHIEF